MTEKIYFSAGTPRVPRLNIVLHIIMKLSKNKDKERILKTSREEVLYPTK